MGRRINTKTFDYFKSLIVKVVIISLVFSLSFPYSSRAFGEFTVKDEIELGKKFNVLIRSKMPLVQDPEVVNYVKGIVARLSKNIPPQPFPFTTSVIRNNSLNAFASPGGYVFVHTGLILAMQNEAQLAGVLAHEMAHITQRHIAKRIESSQIVGLISLVGALAGILLGGDAGGALLGGSMAGGQATMLHYSRSDEHEADQIGMNYLVKAGFSPYGMPGAFGVLSQKQWYMGTSVPSYLSTHPDIQSRASDMLQRIARLPDSLKNQNIPDNNFFKIQTLVRAKYSDPKVALQYFKNSNNKAGISNKNKALNLMGIGIVFSKLNKINDANESFNKALETSPKEPLITREAGIFHYTKGNKAKGAELLKEAISLDSSDIMARFYYSQYLADEGKIDNAIKNTLSIIKSLPEDSEVYEQLAKLYGQNNDLFHANLYMAYSGLYDNNANKVTRFLNQAKKTGLSGKEKQELDKFNKLYEERKEFW